MSGYTKVNLHEEVADISEGRPTEGVVEGRFGRTPLETEQIGLSIFRYAPNFRTPLGHHHRVQEEVYLVVSGSGRVKLGDEVIELRRWDAVRVSPEVVRAFEAGEDGLELVVAGGTRPDGGDGEMVPDFWPAD